MRPLLPAPLFTAQVIVPEDRQIIELDGGDLWQRVPLRPYLR